MLNVHDDEEELPQMLVMSGVTVSMTKPVSAWRIRERMAVEKTDHIVAMDFQNFEALMERFQEYYEKSMVDMQTPFPEAQLLHRFGDPGAQRTWWHCYHW